MNSESAAYNSQPWSLAGMPAYHHRDGWNETKPNEWAECGEIVPHEQLDLRDPWGSEVSLLAKGFIAVEDVGLPGIGDRVYQNLVRRYRLCVEVAGRHIEPFLQVNPEEKQRTVSSRSGRVQHVMVFCLYSPWGITWDNYLLWPFPGHWQGF